MKTKVILFVLTAVVMFFVSCTKDELQVTPSGSINIENIPVSGVSKLEVEDLFQVYVSFSETEESVVVEANNNLLPLVEVRQIDETFFVELDDNVQISGTPHLKVFIKTSTLTHVRASGAVTVKFENTLTANRLNTYIEGASKLEGPVNVSELNAELSGASKLALTGSADLFDIIAEGASEMTGFNFETKNLDAKLEGGCELSLTVQQALDVDASGASKVYYKGNGVIQNQKLRDASAIIKMD